MILPLLRESRFPERFSSHLPYLFFYRPLCIKTCSLSPPSLSNNLFRRFWRKAKSQVLLAVLDPQQGKLQFSSLQNIALKTRQLIYIQNCFQVHLKNDIAHLDPGGISRALGDNLGNQNSFSPGNPEKSGQLRG